MLAQREPRVSFFKDYTGFYLIKNITVQAVDHHGDVNLQLQMTSAGSDVSRDGLKQKS